MICDQFVSTGLGTQKEPEAHAIFHCTSETP